MRFQDKNTGIEFYVGNVHLKCCGEGKDTRAHQAQIIADWVTRSDVPVILTGDFNIPVLPSDTASDVASAAFSTLNGIAPWVRPSNPIKTQCSPRFNSMLDHFFIKDGTNLSTIGVSITEEQADYCDGDKNGYADHRPVVGRFALSP